MLVVKSKFIDHVGVYSSIKHQGHVGKGLLMFWGGRGGGRRGWRRRRGGVTEDALGTTLASGRAEQG